MATINDIRRLIKPLGFNVKTKSLSFGVYATFVHIESKQELNFNVFSAEQLERWKPLLDWKLANVKLLSDVKQETDIKGLLF